MSRSREFKIGVSCLVLAGALGIGSACLQGASDAAEEATGGGEVPMFEVDPLWPMPLPNHWVLGSTIGRQCRGISALVEGSSWSLRQLSPEARSTTMMPLGPVSEESVINAMPAVPRLRSKRMSLR